MFMPTARLPAHSPTSWHAPSWSSVPPPPARPTRASQVLDNTIGAQPQDRPPPPYGGASSSSWQPNQNTRSQDGLPSAPANPWVPRTQMAPPLPSPPSPTPVRNLSPAHGRRIPLPGTRTDKDGQFIVTENEWLNDCYFVVKQLGEGTFSKVVECIDVRTKTPVAVKIIRAVKKYKESAEVELDILRRLMESDKEDKISFIKPLSQFMVEGHMCIVFKKLGLSLYDFLKRNKYLGFCLLDIKKIAQSVLQCIEFFHRLHLIHTDLKPENILFEDDEYIEEAHYGGKLPKSTKLRIIDFGSSIWDHQPHASLIQTRHYRAPEVVLGLGWSYPADMWSCGCILVELLTGEALFQTHDSREHLCMMAKVFGSFPKWMGLDADYKCRKWFKADGSIIPLEASSEGGQYIAKMKNLRELVGHYPDFYDLVTRLLHYDPRKRMTPSQALHHQFFD